MSKLRTATLGIVLLAIGAGYWHWTHLSGSAAKIKGQPNLPAAGSTVLRSETSPAGKPPAIKEGPVAARVGDPPLPSGAKMPLHPGEVLEFVADVSKLTNVANLRLRIVEQRSFFGQDAWHLQALAHTENPLRMVFELDDQFDSYSELSSLSSLQYEMHLNERGQKIESIQRMTTSGGDRSLRNVTETRVLPGTRDPLGLMQFLRTVDWPQARETRGPVYDGHKLYDVRASYQGKAADISVPAGTFSTSKIEVRVFEGGTELKDAHFVLYLAENGARTPVLLEAVMPFATARVALAQMRN
jgi:uncharacterized protein DUF3108